MKKGKGTPKKPSAVQRIRCANIEQQPRFIKACYYNGNRFKSVRSQGFQQRYILASLLKERGNRLFKLGLICYAITEYEQALSIFSYFETVHYANVSQDDLYQVHYVGETDNEISLLRDLRLKLYMNLAACYLKQKLNEDVVKSCDYALEIDASQAKAFYRRAQARNPGEMMLALEDLCRAAELAPNDLDVQKELGKLRLVLRNKQITVTPNTKLTKRPPLTQPEQPQLRVPPPSSRSSSADSSGYSSSDEMTNQEATEFWQQFNIQKDYESFNYELSYEEDPRKPIPAEVNELGHFIEHRGVEMLRLFESQGKVKEAQQLKEKLKKALAAKAQLEKISRLDFSKPKPVFYSVLNRQHLQEIALRFGINLLENQVQNEFRRIQQQNIQDIKNWLSQNQWKNNTVPPAQRLTESSSSDEELFHQGQGSQKGRMSRERPPPDAVIQRHSIPLIEQTILPEQPDPESTVWSPFVVKAILLNAIAIVVFIIYKLFV